MLGERSHRAKLKNAPMQKFPAGFQAKRIKSGDTTLHVRVGGKGPAVVLLHGFGDTGDMWAPLARSW